MQIYSDLEVLQNISRVLPEWCYDRTDISREYQFLEYLQAFEFVRQVASLAESINHHPVILISWRKALIKVHTHSTSSITSLDFELASRIDELFISFSGSPKITC